MTWILCHGVKAQAVNLNGVWWCCRCKTRTGLRCVT